MFLQNNVNATISDFGDVKTATILIEFLVNQNEINRTISITFNRLINRNFSQPYVFYMFSDFFARTVAVSVLTLLVGRQE